MYEVLGGALIGISALNMPPDLMSLNMAYIGLLQSPVIFDQTFRWIGCCDEPLSNYCSNKLHCTVETFVSEHIRRDEKGKHEICKVSS